MKLFVIRRRHYSSGDFEYYNYLDEAWYMSTFTVYDEKETCEEVINRCIKYTTGVEIIEYEVIEK
jgi:hypothetical protein